MTILFIISSATNLHLLERLSLDLSKWNNTVFICYDGTDADLLKKIICIFYSERVIVFHNYILEDNKKYIKKLNRIYKNKQVLLAHAKNHYQKLAISNHILSKTNPDLLITSEDGISGNYWLIGAAKKRHIPCITTPFGFGTSRDLENVLSVKKQNNNLITVSGKYGKILQKKYPHWIKTGDYAGALLFPPEYIIPLEKLGITIPQPWVIQGGVSHKIAVESKKMYQHYLNENISSTKLSLTGTVYCDIIYDIIHSCQKLQESFQTSMPIQPANRSILINWPSNYDPEKGQYSEFKDYEEATLAVMNFLKSLPNTTLTICPHPAVDKKVNDLLEHLGFSVNVHHIIELIPQHDLYISSFSSSIRYAIACGKPVVNYDFYHFSLKDYKGEPGVITLHSFHALKNEITKLLKKDAYIEAAKLQKTSAPEWGIIDGNNFSRINTLIDTVLYRHSRLPTRLRTLLAN